VLCRAPSFLSSLPVPHRNAAILQPRNDDNNRPAATSAAPSKAAAAPVALPPALTFAPRSVNNPLAALQQPGCGKMTAPAPTRLPVQLPACCCVFYLPRSAALVSAELLMRLRHECLQLTCCASCRLACAKGECVAWAGLCALAHVGICVHTHTDTHTHTHTRIHTVPQGYVCKYPLPCTTTAMTGHLESLVHASASLGRCWRLAAAQISSQAACCSTLGLSRLPRCASLATKLDCAATGSVSLTLLV
jgi:hypothetical protein